MRVCSVGLSSVLGSLSRQLATLFEVASFLCLMTAERLVQWAIKRLQLDDIPDALPCR